MVEEFPAQCLGGGAPTLWFGLTVVSVPNFWLRDFGIRLWVKGCLVFRVRVEECRV